MDFENQTDEAGDQMNTAQLLYQDSIQKELRTRESGEHSHDYALMDQLIQELNALGYHFTYATDLVYHTLTDERTIPIFQRFIPQFEDIGFSLSLIPHVSYRGNKDCAKFLLEFYRSREKQGKLSNAARICFDNAFREIKCKEFIPEYLSLISPPVHRDQFYFLMELLSQWKVKEALPIIIQRLDCDQRKLLAIKALGNYPDPELLPILEAYAASNDPAIRNSAKKAMEKIQTSASGQRL